LPTSTACRSGCPSSDGGPVVGRSHVAPAGQWRICASFTTPRAGHQSVVFGDHIFVTGGYCFDAQRNRTAVFNDVQCARLRDIASSGAWQRTTPFVDARSGHGCVVHDGRIYVIGGGDGIRFFSDIQHASIGEDGRIAASGWQTDECPLVVPRSAHGCGVLARKEGPCLYVAGGASSEAGSIVHLDSVEYAPIRADGSVGAWTLCPNRLVGGRAHCGLAIIDGHLHLVGGWGDYDLYADTQQAQILPDGSIGAWTTRRSTMNFARFGHATAHYHDARLPILFVLGGGCAGAPAPKVGPRPTDGRGQANGETRDAAWARTGPTSRGRLYHGPGRYQGDVQYCIVYPNEPSPWIPLPAEFDFAPPRWGHSSAIHEDSLFVLGGHGETGEFLADVLRIDLGRFLSRICQSMPPTAGRTHRAPRT